jgi:hypothetical protein
VSAGVRSVSLHGPSLESCRSKTYRAPPVGGRRRRLGDRRRRHAAQVKQTCRLVLAVREDVAAVTLGRDARDALGVADKHATRLARAQTPAVPVSQTVRVRYVSGRLSLGEGQACVPDLDVAIVRGRAKDVLRRLVGPADRVGVLAVRIDAQRRRVLLEIVDCGQQRQP